MIAIVDYKAGNLTSVKRALEHLGHRCEITDRAEKIIAADRVILPGVGAAGRHDGKSARAQSGRRVAQ